MTTQIMAVVGSWRDGQSVDVPEEMMKITSATLAADMFADALPRSAMSQFMEDMAIMLAGIFRRMLMPP